MLVAAILRFSTLSKLMVFTPDEEYLLYLAQTIVKDFHIIWIGVSALGFDLYMGPFWIYIISPLVLIFKGDPLVLGGLTSFLGILTIPLIYFLGKKIVNARVAITASLLYATSALIVFYDQQPYPPTVPFLSMLLALSLYMSKYKKWWWIIFAASYGMVFHIHLSLALIIVPAIYWGYLQRKSLDKKTVIFTVLAFILAVSPLIAFDYFHKGSNITTPIRIIQSHKFGVPVSREVRFNNLLQTFGRLTFLNVGTSAGDEILYPCIKSKLTTSTRSNWIFILPALILFLLFLFKKSNWKNRGSRLLILLSLSFLLPFLFLNVINPIEYYLLGFFPLLFLMIGSVVESIKYPFKILAYFVVTLFVIHSIFTVFYASGDFGIDSKKQLISSTMHEVGNNPFEISEVGECHQYEGWRYLFTKYGRTPERSSEDPTFIWLYPTEVTKTPAKYSIVLKESRAPRSINKGYVKVLNSGGFSAYLYEH